MKECVLHWPKCELRTAVDNNLKSPSNFIPQPDASSLAKPNKNDDRCLRLRSLGNRSPTGECALHRSETGIHTIVDCSLRLSRTLTGVRAFYWSVREIYTTTDGCLRLLTIFPQVIEIPAAFQFAHVPRSQSFFTPNQISGAQVTL